MVGLTDFRLCVWSRADRTLLKATAAEHVAATAAAANAELQLNLASSLAVAPGDTPLVFPAARGGHIGLDGWRTRHWYPALEAAGIRQRGPYQLRHTFATEALAAGISIFELARVMGASVKTIDRHYGHLARDSDQAIRARLDARAERTGDELASRPG